MNESPDPRAESPASPQPGDAADLRERLDRALRPEFEVVRSLGRGRMADVFLAREVELRRLVAVKVLRPELAVQDAPRQRFLREARSAASISHPNVVKIHRVGSLEDRTPFLIMEYVDGRTMEDVLAADGPRSEKEVRELLVEMASALQAAHAEGITHRDVRPNNIMRTKAEDRFVLTDFGVAGILESGESNTSRLTGAGEILGDARFTAPEQIEGNPVRPESDVYALAVTAYELLTGENPYGAQKVAEILQAHLTREPTPISRLRPGTGEDLENLLLRCLSKRPEHRPPPRMIARRLSGEDPLHGTGPVEGEGSFRAFLRELKRRRVYKAGATYAAVAVVALSVADPLAVLMPEWIFRIVILLVLAGFPTTLVLAWIYDVTEGGLQRTTGPTEAGSRSTRMLQVTGLVISLGLVIAVGWFLLT